MSLKIPVGVSNRHLHVSKADLATLFGEGYQLTVLKELRQPGQYAAQETVTLVGPKGEIEGVRILGPVRPATQVEISCTDSFRLGIKPPVRESGALSGSPALKLRGPAGETEVAETAILAWRHIHMHTSEAEQLGVKDRDMVSVMIPGDRSMTFHNIIVRVRPDFALEFHVDT
ncbi:MAG TPA: phosphate propanoyltransferase, partial [Bacillota bacterium]|nr:phosphate propanoyltransferase [Bacillota bacterium]